MAASQTQDQDKAPSRSASRKPAPRAAAAARRKAGETRNAGAQTPDAIQLLIQDHREVDALFKRYEEIKDGDDENLKLALAESISLALLVHTQIEEEIFYPKVRQALGEEGADEVDEALVEHQAAKDLIEKIEAMEPGEELFDARVHVLSEEIRHHVQEEEHEMFPAVQKSGKLDLKALGEQLARRKDALTRELANED